VVRVLQRQTNDIGTSATHSAHRHPAAIRSAHGTARTDGSPGTRFRQETPGAHLLRACVGHHMGGFLLVGGPGLFAGTNCQSDPLFQYAVLALLAVPPVACLLLTCLVSGRVGLRDLLGPLQRWSVSARW
jgi:hypothetical protein